MGIRAGLPSSAREEGDWGGRTPPSPDHGHQKRPWNTSFRLRISVLIAPCPSLAGWPVWGHKESRANWIFWAAWAPGVAVMWEWGWSLGSPGFHPRAWPGLASIVRVLGKSCLLA